MFSWPSSCMLLLIMCLRHLKPLWVKSLSCWDEQARPTLKIMVYQASVFISWPWI